MLNKQKERESEKEIIFFFLIYHTALKTRVSKSSGLGSGSVENTEFSSLIIHLKFIGYDRLFTASKS
jgi:hypothetical protein